MADTCHHLCSQPRECALWPLMHTVDSGGQGCVGVLTVCDKRPTLTGTLIVGEAVHRRVGEGAWEFYVSFPQLCCEPKTTPKSNLSFFKKTQYDKHVCI